MDRLGMGDGEAAGSCASWPLRLPMLLKAPDPKAKAASHCDAIGLTMLLNSGS